VPHDPTPELPIDALLPQLVESLRAHRNLVLVAPPGAGKTTRVPTAVLDAGLAGEREIVVLEPRRLAARLAAGRVAQERGEPVGRTVGYQVRFERAIGRDTRIRFVTEGVLSRQLVGDPTMARVGVVIADEIHERHLAGDVALARARALQAGPRPDLRIIAMSATIEAAPLAAYLDAPVLTSDGRVHPVTIDYLPPQEGWPLDKQVSAAVRRAVADGLDGDVLVFLPGAGEIRRAQTACADIAASADLQLVLLHGDLPAAEQDRALARSSRRKVILSTNVAESSVTIDGVAVVIDSGLARVARHSPWTGLPALRLEPISQASATQRTGRAGRTRPGRCLRLYTRHDFDTRRAGDTPEILRADLCETALELRAVGLDLNGLEWLDAPPTAARDAAETLLDRLGAVAGDGALTEIGRRMVRFPAHPRLARLVVEAERRGVAHKGCALAALAGERELRAARRGAGLRGQDAVAEVSGPSDVLDDLARFEHARGGGRRPDRLRADGIDPGAFRAVDRACSQLERLVDTSVPAPRTVDEVDEALAIAVLAGFPDRLARRRSKGSRELVFAGGGGGSLSPASVVLDAELMVCVKAGERGGGRAQVLVQSASAVHPDWLLDLYIDRVTDRDGLEWNPSAQRVEWVSRLEYDGLTLEEQRDPGRARLDPQASGRVLAEAVRGAEASSFVDAAAIAAWRRRVALAQAHAPTLALPTIDEARVLDAVIAATPGRVSFAELRAVGPTELLRGGLTGPALAAIERLAPEHVSLPGRKRVPINYEDDRPPWIESRIQDFFGLTEGPRVGAGAVPLVLHLLAPNRRAVQVTTDLRGFWAKHYPQLRNQLMRRYPRHKWPEHPG
jgi:ATP-dependent helicase HrpB